MTAACAIVKAFGYFVPADTRPAGKFVRRGDKVASDKNDDALE